ncbi:MAG TPA: ribosome recycling factor [Candidatus Paceibacterota bacterium]
MDIKVFEQRLQQIVAALKQEYQSLRGNRPSTKMVEDIKVEYYGQIMPVKQMGSISISPPREIVIQVWDLAAVAAVAKAIEASSLSVVANTNGTTIRIQLPQLTEERRKELEKVVRKTTEEARIKIRGVRDEINKEIKKAEEEKKYSEDAAFKQKEAAQKIVDRCNKEIEIALEVKIKEIFE